jgi:hypothetical protein
MTSLSSIICPCCGAQIAPSLAMLIAARSRRSVVPTPGLRAEKLKRRRKRAFVRPGLATETEVAIRAALMGGADSPEIADEAGVSLGTVQRVRKALFRDSFAHHLARAAAR